MAVQDIWLNDVIIPGLLNYGSGDCTYHAYEMEFSEPVKCIRYYDPSNPTYTGAKYNSSAREYVYETIFDSNGKYASQYFSDCYLKKVSYIQELIKFSLAAKGSLAAEEGNYNSKYWNKLYPRFLLMYDQDGNVITNNLFNGAKFSYSPDEYGDGSDDHNTKPQLRFSIQSSKNLIISRIDYYIAASKGLRNYTIVDSDGNEQNFAYSKSDYKTLPEQGMIYAQICSIDTNINLRAYQEKFVVIDIDTINK